MSIDYGLACAKCRKFIPITTDYLGGGAMHPEAAKTLPIFVSTHLHEFGGRDLYVIREQTPEWYDFEEMDAEAVRREQEERTR
jgi:hypothetical protein